LFPKVEELGNEMIFIFGLRWKKENKKEKKEEKKEEKKKRRKWSGGASGRSYRRLRPEPPACPWPEPPGEVLLAVPLMRPCSQRLSRGFGVPTGTGAEGSV
jgi:hypothetical protein